jgi:hypothetical protein
MKDIIKKLLPNFILKPVQDILKLSRKKHYINNKSTIAIGHYDETFSLLPFNLNNIYKGEI